MTDRLIVLSHFDAGDEARLQSIMDGVDIAFVSSGAELQASAKENPGVVLTFGTGEILSAQLLASLKLPAYNLHAASPDFPGRDPHHHAVYHGATQYGATLHLITPSVDSGPIVAVERFAVPPGVTPTELLGLANECAWKLLASVGPRIVGSSPMAEVKTEKWGGIKTRRADLHRLARVSPLISPEELVRRSHALNTPNHNNLLVVLHGQTFRYDPAAAPRKPQKRDEDFTIAAYARLLSSLKERSYRFARYTDRLEGRHVIWRHDVDFSMHRAACLAELEAKEGVVATYFVNPHSTFYNLLEPAVTNCTRRILAAGHEIGLHFDTAAFPEENWTKSILEKRLSEEKHLLELITGQQVSCVSWHNPGLLNLTDFGEDELCGLQNAYSERLRTAYTYCSDSNGYWRFKSIQQVIDEGHEQLHLLTHPGWWTDTPMTPAERIERAILGRARAVRADHDAVLEVSNRIEPD